MRDSSLRLMPSDTAIQPLIVGGAVETLAISAQLADCGLLVPAIRPPTVPRGTSRLRISLSADHSHDDVALLVAALRSLSTAV
jgi:8-amino-7-oxononanoate synthase